MASRKQGQPTKYSKKADERVFRLCLLGLTDKQLAESFDISKSTLNLWKKSHPSFSDSIKAGKVDADAKVAVSLYDRARGYSHPEDKVFCSNGETTIVPTTKHYPPDTAAAFIWLKNRAGWKDKTETDHTGSVTIVSTPADKKCL